MKTPYIIKLPEVQREILFEIASDLGFSATKGKETVCFFWVEKEDLEILWEIFLEKFREIITEKSS